MDHALANAGEWEAMYHAFAITSSLTQADGEAARGVECAAAGGRCSMSHSLTSRRRAAKAAGVAAGWKAVS